MTQRRIRPQQYLQCHCKCKKLSTKLSIQSKSKASIYSFLAGYFVSIALQKQRTNSEKDCFYRSNYSTVSKLLMQRPKWNREVCAHRETQRKLLNAPHHVQKSESALLKENMLRYMDPCIRSHPYQKEACFSYHGIDVKAATGL